MGRYLGVDGGGSKTAFCLLDSAGDVLAVTHAPTLCYFGADIAMVGDVLERGLRDVCRAAGTAPSAIDYAFVGIPGYGEVSGDAPALDAVPRCLLGHDRYECDNDMVAGFAGSLGARDGVTVISGTGSMAYGEHEGAKARVGGWGELFGDEGSAYWIAVEALRATSKMMDGRRAPGQLVAVLRDHLELTVDFDLIDVVLNRWQGQRGKVAALAREVDRAATRGDETALQILDAAGLELARHAHAACRRLGFGASQQVSVSWSGGVFGSEIVREAFKVHVLAGQQRCRLVAPKFAPWVGAALYAADLAGDALREAALSRLASSTQ